MSKTVTVTVQRDHLEWLIATRRPIDAIVELIWNGLDADATKVSVTLRYEIDLISSIEVVDNGNGFSFEEALLGFGNLGGSLKKENARTPGGRRYHGKLGKGRFRAFHLGSPVVWTTAYRAADGRLMTYTIEGRRDALSTFEIDEPSPSTGKATGTAVVIQNVAKNFQSLKDVTEATDELAQEFALYLRQHPNVQITYDGQRVDPGAAEVLLRDYDLGQVVLGPDRYARAGLTIIEWKNEATKRALFLCDSAGFLLHELPPGIHAPGYAFTAYLKSERLRELQGDLVLEDFHPDVRKLVDAARERMRAHFKARDAESRAAKVAQWKRDQVYPFAGEPQDLVEETERQVFDVVAINVTEVVPDIEEGTPKARRLAFRLLREALTASPTALQRILTEVVELPTAKLEEMAALIQRTSLEAIITASKVVASRLDFLEGLSALVFDDPHKDQVKERSQLHRILADHTWLFGEAYNLSVDDQSLTQCLIAHLGTEKDVGGPVLMSDGSKGIIDMMLSRRIPQPDDADRAHLVVELKAPKQPVNWDAYGQILGYALAIVKDDRFRNVPARWDFWVLSTSVTADVENLARSGDRPRGCVHVGNPQDPPYRIWVKTWSEIIEDARSRLAFFRKHLNYAADSQTGLEYLRQAHARYLPRSAQPEPQPLLPAEPSAQSGPSL